jgi:hypothetical protein
MAVSISNFAPAGGDNQFIVVFSLGQSDKLMVFNDLPPH